MYIYIYVVYIIYMQRASSKLFYTSPRQFSDANDIQRKLHDDTAAFVTILNSTLLRGETSQILDHPFPSGDAGRVSPANQPPSSYPSAVYIYYIVYICFSLAGSARGLFSAMAVVVVVADGITHKPS